MTRGYAWIIGTNCYGSSVCHGRPTDSEPVHFIKQLLMKLTVVENEIRDDYGEFKQNGMT